jgi:octanoyl-[GcvH]:protein N-octanoyltransferase
LLTTNFTIADVMLRLLNQLKENSELLYAGPLNDYELALFPSYYQRVIDRNEKIAAM